MSRCDLKNWPILSLLESDFIAELKTVMVFGNLGDEALMVMNDGSVYAVGNNTTGCLGTGDTHSTLHPTKIEALSCKGIKTFAYGIGPHVLALTESGEVYSWGHNGYGQLGNGSSNAVSTPTKIQTSLANTRVIEVACGSHHSLALTDKGEVYAWGQNSSGQLGSSAGSNQNTPRKVNSVLTGRRVVSIACGHSSSMAVTSNGEVYGWGNGSIGRVGTDRYTDDSYYYTTNQQYNEVNTQKVGGLAGVVIEKIACGYSHTLALSDDGSLYVWGDNAYGQLGLGNKKNSSVAQKLCVPKMERISDIAAVHYNHISVAVSHANHVFIWGQCRGQSVKEPTLTPFTSIHQALAAYATPSVMHVPLKLSCQEETSIVECLKQAFDDPSTSDLTIQVHGKPIHVHKALLKIRCQYFRSMFQEHWTENNKQLIEHDDFSYDVYRAFLKYLYTDEVELPAETALELLNLANVYVEPQLKRRCVQIIKQGITISNMGFLYKTAIEYDARDLEDFCFKFAMNHMTAVVQTPNFAKLDEATVKNFIAKAAKAGSFKT